MWRFGNGLKRLFILSLLLVLAVGSLSAWSFGWGKQAETPPAQAVAVQEATPLDLQLIVDLQEVLKEQEVVLLKAKADLTQSQKDLAQSQRELNLARLESTKASLEIERLNALLTISVASQNDMAAQLQDEQKLRIAKEAESLKYYQSMMENVRPTWGGVMGAGTTWKPSDGTFSLDLSMGVRYDSWALTVGAQMNPAWNNLLDFSAYIPSAYTASLQFNY